MNDFNQNSSIYPQWRDGAPCPYDTDGDGNCHMCSKPELQHYHVYRAKAMLQKLAEPMADLLMLMHSEGVPSDYNQELNRIVEEFLLPLAKGKKP